MKKHRLGVGYYPELYPRERQDEMVREDIALMKQAGFSVVRMAEFTWCLMEPREGEYDFDWLENFVNLLGENGIYTVMCTPSVTPPVWMTEKYPQILYVDNHGVRRGPGGRHYTCYNNPDYLEMVRKVCSAMGERFGKNPYVLGFQVDNEFGLEHSARCQCPVCRSLFRDYMRKRFDNSIDRLNAELGTLFWGQSYASFDEVQPPAMARRLDTSDNTGWLGTSSPALRLAFKRFCSESLVNFFCVQRDALAQYTDKPITHNTTHFAVRALDFFDLAREMELAGVDHYPSAVATDKIQSGMIYSMARNYKDRDFWLLETLCGGGHGNWANQGMPQPHPGAFRENMAYAFASGAEVITAFKYCVFPAGFEQLGSALMDLDRVPRRRYYEFAEAGQDLLRMEPILNSTKLKSPIAILMDYDSLWANYIKPIHKEFVYEMYIRQLFGHLNALGVNVDIIGPDHDLSGYQLVVMPFAPIMKESTKAACRAYVENGGSFAAICLPASRNVLGNGEFESMPLGLTDFFGARVAEVEPVFFGSTDARVSVGGLTIGSCYWQETLELQGAEAVGVFADTYRKGLPVITRNPYGKGHVYYVGTAPQPEDAPAFYRWLADESGVVSAPVSGPYGFDLVTRTGEGKTYYFVFNSLEVPMTLTLSRPLSNCWTDEPVSGALELPAKGFTVLAEV